MSKVDTVKSKWEEKKPIAFAFALGLVLGPFISNMISVERDHLLEIFGKYAALSRHLPYLVFCICCVECDPVENV